MAYGGPLKTEKPIMNFDLSRIVGLSLLLSLPFALQGAELGTRQRTIRPVALPADTPAVVATNIPAYGVYGYSAWEWGPGEDAGRDSCDRPNPRRPRMRPGS